jgi:hypothetical protein
MMYAHAFLGTVASPLTDASPVEAVERLHKDMEAILRRLRAMTKKAETQINAIVLFSTRARQQDLAAPPGKKPTMHRAQTSITAR